MIRMRGRLLLYDTLDDAGYLFPKDCDLTYPERVPVVMDYIFNDPGTVIGSATVIKDEKGLMCDVELTNFDQDILRHEFNDELYIGGYYNKVKITKKINDMRAVTKAALVGISTTLLPANEEMKIKFVEEKKE